MMRQARRSWIPIVKSRTRSRYFSRRLNESARVSPRYATSVRRSCCFLDVCAPARAKARWFGRRSRILSRYTSCTTRGMPGLTPMAGSSGERQSMVVARAGKHLATSGSLCSRTPMPDTSRGTSTRPMNGASRNALQHTRSIVDAVHHGKAHRCCKESWCAAAAVHA